MRERAIGVVDLGFGDAGKGLVTDFLVRSLGAALVVRFNGGAQAGHNVVTPDGRHHTFSQLGSGSFVPGVRTHLARRVVVHPTALLAEASSLAAAGVSDALAGLTVHDDALVVTPFHQAACRLRELARGGARHGSCGVGVGEVALDALLHPADAVRARDLHDAGSLRRRLERVRERLRASLGQAGREAAEGEREARVLGDPGFADAWIDATRPFVGRVAMSDERVVEAALRDGRHVVFEGAQGVLLDEDWGFHPHTTWSHCTFANAEEILRELRCDERLVRVGVARAYAHRHGVGPLPTEARLGDPWSEPHNVDGPWQGPFRVGWPDLVLARYARAVSGGVDALALTHKDALARRAEWRVAESYDEARIATWPEVPPHDLDARAKSTERLARVVPDYATVRPADVEDALAGAFGAPIRLASHGPTAADVRSDWFT
jgi:adenylosuccinate synthase